ncbi:retinal cone rhodopsin-sensitive cGMP 3',5'-cyclic phosphodiesterase subunit gamma-like [Xenopus laevis]|nr:retinal cone rhodopsin-sensitive cGMP 3',5'-cyclic phosphodiesterase subunit gamma-like [Xenopus laevis]
MGHRTNVLGEESKGTQVKVTEEANVPTENFGATSSQPPARSGPTTKKGPKFKQRGSKEFKSKPPKRGVIGFEEIPGMDGLGADITIICPWEAYSHLELHELAQYGII